MSDIKSFAEALQEVVSKYPDLSPTEIAVGLKSITEDKTTRVGIFLQKMSMTKSLDAFHADFGFVPRANFIKLVKQTWDKKYPEHAPPKRIKTLYQIFLHEKTLELKTMYPTMSGKERKTMVLEQWKSQKGTDNLSSFSMQTNETEASSQGTEQELRRSKRSRLSAKA